MCGAICFHYLLPRDYKDISTHLLTIQELLAEQSDPQAIGGLMDTRSSEMRDHLQEKPGVCALPVQVEQQPLSSLISNHSDVSASRGKFEESNLEPIDENEKKLRDGLQKSYSFYENLYQPPSHALSERERKSTSVATNL